MEGTWRPAGCRSFPQQLGSIVRLRVPMQERGGKTGENAQLSLCGVRNASDFPIEQTERAIYHCLSEQQVVWK